MITLLVRTLKFRANLDDENLHPMCGASFVVIFNIMATG
jgi:uncharacterized protein YqhQ